LVTGEAKFHSCLEAEATGICLILVGHFASERFAAIRMADELAQGFPGLTVWASQRERDPLRVA
jgi:putative NIF3 family GTP cyclohydrolase 1 type 2